ncbi:hypothetical protein [Psychroserpens sp.]|uniref:hypothetical protein n=1 Tax=Psychroserpens sp. TaxID=2020870 RepID=UPI002B27902B|nr:hypothetical protein [Psychroserpens sp.]
MKDFKLNDVLISILIISITLLYFLDKYFIPQGIETITIYGFEIGSFGFLDIGSFVNFLKTKILIILFGTIWFLTCRHWWKPAILILITIEFTKLIVTFNSSIEHIDAIDYLISLPITVPFILVLLYISNKLNSYNLKKELRTKVDNEIDEVFFQLQEVKINEFEKLKSALDEIKKEKSIIDTKEYLEKIILLRDKFYNT